MAPDTATDALMDDIMAQMASSQLSRRSSRASSNRRSARIEKPRSAHASPRVIDRRRTMNSTGSRLSYPTLEDHYKAMFGATSTLIDDSSSENHSTSSRPYSWHPSSTRFSATFYNSSSSMDSRSSQSFHVGLDSQTESSSYQQIASQTSTPKQMNEPFPAAEVAAQTEDAWSSFFGTPVPTRSGPPSYTAVVEEPTSWFLPEYSQVSYEPPQYSNLPASRDAPSDFLPIQRPSANAVDADIKMGEDEDHALTRQESKELIGMGLYDDPETTPFNLLTGGGRGLKLEEEWAPPEEMINDSEDADGEDESSEDETEPPHPVRSQKPVTATFQGQQQLPLVNMAGQSFLFDDADEDTVPTQWWYPAKQPTVVMEHYGITGIAC